MGLSAYLYDGIRTPFGRHGGALAALGVSYWIGSRADGDEDPPQPQTS